VILFVRRQKHYKDLYMRNIPLSYYIFPNAREDNSNCGVAA